MKTDLPVTCENIAWLLLPINTKLRSERLISHRFSTSSDKSTSLTSGSTVILCSRAHPPPHAPLSCSSCHLLAHSLLCLKTRHCLLTVDSSSLRTTRVCHLLGAFSDSPGLWVPWPMHRSPQLCPLLQFLKTSICLSDRCCLNLVCVLWRSCTCPPVYIRRSVGLNTLLLTGFLRDKKKVEKTKLRISRDPLRKEDRRCPVKAKPEWALFLMSLPWIENRELLAPEESQTGKRKPGTLLFPTLVF